MVWFQRFFGSPLGEFLQVVAGAEGFAGACQHDDMDAVVVISRRHCAPDLARHLVVDGVQAAPAG
jgi:hypothetical protein